MLVQIDHSRKFYIYGVQIVVLIFILILQSIPAWSAQVSLAWDPNTESDLAGYNIHYGQSSNDYQYSVDVGNFTSATISGLTEGQIYFFAASAYDTDGNESSLSEEIAYTVPIPDDGGNDVSYAVYEDAEDGTTNGWEIYADYPAGARIINIFDNDRQSRVIQLAGSGISNGYWLRNADGSIWNNTNQFIVEWSMNYSESFQVFFDVQTDQGHRYIYYTPEDYDGLGNLEYVHHGLGSNIIDGQWHTFVLNLQADLHDAQPGVNITAVNGFLIRGSGKVDDIKLLQSSNSVNDVSYAVYEDAEDGTTYGWEIYADYPAGARIINIFDNDRQSRVIQLAGSGISNGYWLRNADGSIWNNTNQFIVEWSMNYSESFQVFFDVQTDQGHRYIYYTPEDYDGLGNLEYVHHGLGSNIIDGQWHTFVLNLQADLHDAQPGVNITAVNGFLIRGSGKVDDIKLLQSSNSVNDVSYAVYEDAEDGTTYGWEIYADYPAGARIINIFDNDRQSRVIQLAGSGISNGYWLRNADGSIWNNTNQFIVEWSMNYSESFQVFFDVQTDQGHRYIYYTPEDYDGLGNLEYVHHGLGSNIIDGQWHTFVLNLQADLHDAQPGVNITAVNGFLIRGSGKVDDIKLSTNE